MRLLGLAAILLLTTAGAWGQTAAPGSVQRTDDDPGSQRKLTVWRVVTERQPRAATIASLVPKVHTATPGEFGQTAGSFGDTAGSTGTTAGSFGRTAGSAGTTAGSTGQSVGGFGESLDTIAAASSVSNGSSVTSPAATAAAKGIAVAPVIRDAAWERFTGEIAGSFGGTVTYEDVGAGELQERLNAVAGKEEAPDVLVAWKLPRSRLDRVSSGYSLKTVGDVALIPQTESPESGKESPEAAILLRAPHPEAARAFVLLLQARKIEPREYPGAWWERQTPVILAKSALASVLSGGSVDGEADPEIAHFNTQAAQQLALQPDVYRAQLEGPSLEDLKIEIHTQPALMNERFAVVALRAVVENRGNFGEVHAIAVLRTDAAGQWKLLQLTPNLRVEQQEEAVRELRDFAATVRRDTVEQLSRVALAAPVDGDVRPLLPELWWSTPSGGTMAIVEWQRGVSGGWTSSNLYFVPGETGHLRTRTTGRFADAPGLYRWRVWSMGRGGTVAISLWRSVNIVTGQARVEEREP